MASLPTTALALSAYRHSTWTLAKLPCNGNAGSMQLQCNSFGGLCKRSANRVQSQCKSLNGSRGSALLLLANAEVLAGFCFVRPSAVAITWS